MPADEIQQIAYHQHAGDERNDEPERYALDVCDAKFSHNS